MSDLRIRSEAVRDVWPQAFLPPQVRAEDRFGDAGDADFAPFLAAAARSLTALFGVAVSVVPGRPPAEPAARVAPALAGLLATVRMGGDPALPAAASGIALKRYAGVIADTVDAVAARAWPAMAAEIGYDLDVSCGTVTGHLHVPPPLIPRPAPSPLLPGPQLDDLPLRLRVELASDMVSVTSLLPLRTGSVLPIAPVPDMPLIIGDHRIGRVSVAPLPDGRQQACITAIAVEHWGARP